MASRRLFVGIYCIMISSFQVKGMRYQQLLAGYDTASAHPMARQLDAAKQLAEVRELEEQVKEAEDKVKRAAVQPGSSCSRGFLVAF